jgi:hypothetical protein
LRYRTGVQTLVGKIVGAHFRSLRVVGSNINGYLELFHQNWNLPASLSLLDRLNFWWGEKRFCRQSQKLDLANIGYSSRNNLIQNGSTG